MDLKQCYLIWHAFSHSLRDVVNEQIVSPFVIQGHRGFSSDYPENTILAFRKAIEAGANRIETDLWISSDGIPILLHDRSVDRTTDGTGNADTLTLEQIQSLDAGSWKDEKFSGNHIPSLEDAVDLIVQKKGVELNLEIKIHGQPVRAQSIIAASVDIVKAKNAEASIVYSSFDLDALLQVRKLSADVRLILLYWKNDLADRGFGIAQAHKLYGLAAMRDYLTAEIVHEAVQAGIHIFVGSPDKQQTLTAYNWGVSGFANNNPSLLLTWLKGKDDTRQ